MASFATAHDSTLVEWLFECLLALLLMRTPVQEGVQIMAEDYTTVYWPCGPGDTMLKVGDKVEYHLEDHSTPGNQIASEVHHID
ncbi:MAG: hypothetical protein M1824_000518 [Vezdaea acicularis]|nr:MAG: hypothetical protein M1824_000518 [Vezdaea acicularis]